MPKPVPAMRLDAEYMEDVELYLTRMTLERAADMINARTRTGRIYGQILLPPEQAAMKGGQQ